MEQVVEAEKILEKLRAAIKLRTADVDGVSGIRGLARNFRLCDKNRNGTLDLDEFARCVSMCKLGLSPDQVTKLFNYFDHDSSGAIDYNEFLRAARGPLPAARRKLVLQAFRALDAQGDGNGVLTVEDIEPYYDASRHPDVVAGRLDKGSALRHFLDGFEGVMGDRDGVITVQEWLEHYEDISASIDSDDYFAAMMAKTWGHLKAPGPKGKPAVSPHVPTKDVDALEMILYNATYRRKGGSNHAQERLLNDTFKIFDADGSNSIDKLEFLKAMERFGLPVRGKGRPGIGGLTEDVVLALFDRYDTDQSGTLSFREFSTAFLQRHQERSEPMPAEEYKAPPKAYKAGFEGEPMDDTELRHLKPRRDPELMGARQAMMVAPGRGSRGYLSAAAKVHGTASGSGNKGSSGSGKPFR